MEVLGKWWAIKDLNLGPLACEASALTTELIARTSKLAGSPGSPNQYFRGLEVEPQPGNIL